MKVLLSAFACDPTKGSEPGIGWNWTIALSHHGYEVHCLTRKKNEKFINQASYNRNIHFHFVGLPFGLEKFYSSSQVTMYLYYLLWQYLAYRKARKIHKKVGFDIVHHITWGSLQLSSFMSRLGIPFLFGPSGGGQMAPNKLSHYLGKYWNTEIRRKNTSNLLRILNPAFKETMKNAKAVLVTNNETLELTKKHRSGRTDLLLDVGLSSSFFPSEYPERKSSDTLKLLWVGRIYPRKGLNLTLEVMAALREYKNIQLTIVGDGPLMNEMKDYIINNNLTDTVHFVGIVPFLEVKQYYINHDIFLFTSLRDSCPVQLLEAMANGLPVITLDLHGQGLLVTHETGIKCSIEQPGKIVGLLKNAVLDLYNDKDKRIKLGQSAYRCSKEHVWDRKINYIIDTYYRN